jgi:hypothetical protein
MIGVSSRAGTNAGSGGSATSTPGDRAEDASAATRRKVRREPRIGVSDRAEAASGAGTDSSSSCWSICDATATHWSSSGALLPEGASAPRGAAASRPHAGHHIGITDLAEDGFGVWKVAPHR